MGGILSTVAGEEFEARGGWDEVQMVFVRGEEEGFAGPEGGAVHGPRAFGAHDREPAPATGGRAAERIGELEEVRREVLALQQLHRSVLPTVVMRPVVVRDGIVDRILGELGMELAGFAVQTRAVVVVYAVGDVGGFLDLDKAASAADGVDAAGRDEENVSGLDLIVAQSLDDAPVLHAAGILIRSDLLRETGVQMRPFVRPDDVPHLGLAPAAVPCGGQGVIGMDLYAQVATGVDELYQQRELPAIHLAKRPAGLGTLGNDGFRAGHSGQHPALTPPHQGLEYRLEPVH